jgi:molybdenum cofactor biosynthesis enzyme MoaA
VHAASLSTAKRVLDAAWQGGVRGVLFTGGGEPLVWEHLPEALRYSASLGMDNCLYTNGFRLGTDKDLATTLLDPAAGLVFVRVSVNAISQHVVQKHWGLSVIRVDHQMGGLAALLQARRPGNPSTLGWSGRFLQFRSARSSIG